MSRLDYYNVLGLKRDATPDEIKKAYRHLALQYHPDRNPDDTEAARRFREATEAYETLSDAEKRLRYDRLGPLYTPSGRPPTPEEMGELLSDTLGGLFRRRKRAESGEDLRYTLSISLEECASGMVEQVEFPREIRCKRCGGGGADPDKGRRECASCDGSGRTQTRRLFRHQCARCDGLGYIVIKHCERCEATGRQGSQERLKVKVPAGVANGQKLKIAGRGNEGLRGGQSGDLYVVVQVSDHALFQRRGSDLVCELPLTFSELALGAEVVVPTLEGKTTIRVPAATMPGKLLKLSGKYCTTRVLHLCRKTLA